MRRSMNKLLILIILSLFIISCGEDITKEKEKEKKDYCKDVNCINGSCKVEKNRAICLCNKGFHEEDLVCIKDILTKEKISLACEKIISCKISQEEDVKLCSEKYNSFYHSNLDGIYAYYMPVGKTIEIYINCINDSNNSCEKMKECYNNLMKISFTNEECNDNNLLCEGDKLRSCKDGKVKYQDCSAINKKCLDLDNRSKCSNDSKCDSSNFKTYCNEKGSVVYCKNGVTKEIFCPYYNQICETKNQLTKCYPKEKLIKCEGNHISCRDKDMISCKDNIEYKTSCELFGENFRCKNINYSVGNLAKKTYGCFYDETSK